MCHRGFKIIVPAQVTHSLCGKVGFQCHPKLSRLLSRYTVHVKCQGFSQPHVSSISQSSFTAGPCTTPFILFIFLTSAAVLGLLPDRGEKKRCCDPRLKSIFCKTIISCTTLKHYSETLKSKSAVNHYFHLVLLSMVATINPTNIIAGY